MNRCLRILLAALPALVFAATGGAVAQVSSQLPDQNQAPSQAQNPNQAPAIGVRHFPAGARRGWLEGKALPTVLINGTEERLAPGARIRDQNNQMVMSANLAGRKLEVNYTRDAQGMIREVWIINRQEARQDIEGSGPLRNFSFGSDADKGPRDDGKTPFDQLPKYKN